MNADRQASKLIAPAGDNNPPGSTQMCEVTLTTRCGSPKGARVIADIATIVESVRAAVAAATPPTGSFPQALTVNIRTESGPPGLVSMFGVIRISVPVRVGEGGKGEVDQAAVQSALLGSLMGSKVSIPLR